MSERNDHLSEIKFNLVFLAILTSLAIAAFYIDVTVVKFIGVFAEHLLEKQIPVEQLPLVIGKLQMAYDLFNALDGENTQSFNLLSLWPLLLENEGGPRQNATIFGHVLVEHFTQHNSVEHLHQRFYQQLDQR